MSEAETRAPVPVYAGYLRVLRSRMQALGESTHAIRASVITDGWYFRTAPPPEARVIGMRGGYRWALTPLPELQR